MYYLKGKRAVEERQEPVEGQRVGNFLNDLLPESALLAAAIVSRLILIIVTVMTVIIR